MPSAPIDDLDSLTNASENLSFDQAPHAAIAAAPDELPTGESAQSAETALEQSESNLAEIPGDLSPTSAEVVATVESEMQQVSADQLQQLRVSHADQIRLQVKLPKGLREHFSKLVMHHGEASNLPGSQLMVPVASVLEVIEKAVPRLFSLTSDDLQEREHPAGERFFNGRAHEGALSDEEAEHIARAQLVRTGFARPT